MCRPARTCSLKDALPIPSIVIVHVSLIIIEVLILRRKQDLYLQSLSWREGRSAFDALCTEPVDLGETLLNTPLLQ